MSQLHRQGQVEKHTGETPFSAVGGGAIEEKVPSCDDSHHCRVNQLGGI